MLGRIGAAAGLLLATAVAAAETRVDGVSRGDEITTVHRVDMDHVVVWTVTEFDPVETEEESPFAGLGGPCFGQVEFAGEAVSGGGYCTWTDGDGDSYVARWTATAPGPAGSGLGVGLGTGTVPTAGEWTALGGTGKWEGVTGGGTYEIAEELETGRRVKRLEGRLTLR